jgi:hypothetical protein
MPQLDPYGNPVVVGNIRLTTPGLAGTAESFVPRPGGTRGTDMQAAEMTTAALDAALSEEHLQPQETLEIRGTAEIRVNASTRSTGYGEPAIVAEVPDAGEDWGQVLLYTDEAGVTTWNFPVDDQNRVSTARGAATRTYVIRRYVAEPPAQAPTRGLIGAVGTKVLKVLAFPLIDPVAGKVGDYFAGRWEQAKRPYRIRTFTPDDYASPDAAELDAPSWSRLSGGRALLMVHGTFSRAHTAFGSLPKGFVEELHRHYQGRVFAFDHFTVSEDPRENVDWLLRQIPDGTSLELDVICHSRGGLVSRVLAERQAELSLGARSLAIDKVVFVGAPNAGTVLTDTKHLSDLIDSYTNILNFFPDNGVTDVLQAVIAVMKQLAVGAVKGMRGLESMLPGGQFLRDWLNRGAQGTELYYAIASNYEPTQPGLAAWAKDRLMDRVFDHAQNDLVVPTLGVYEENGSDLFPIADRLVFPPESGIQHGGYFPDPATQEQIRGWLGV